MARGDINPPNDWSAAYDTGGGIYSGKQKVAEMRQKAAGNLGEQREPEEDESILDAILGSANTGSSWGMTTQSPYVGIAAGGLDFLNRMGVFD